ncbi:hypothetical protein EDC96DRAFT_537292 [Choanephora cucurbitarum]|nr:hypothetical protein EDC96DRAFT_537292 [Choanephora cucurbitarum]
MQLLCNTSIRLFSCSPWLRFLTLYTLVYSLFLRSNDDAVVQLTILCNDILCGLSACLHQFLLLIIVDYNL